MNLKRLTLVCSVFLFSIATMLAQRTVTGTITDDTGEALIGASVVVKGTNIGTTTDIDGTYSVEVPENVNTLVYTYTGYRSQEKELGASNVMDVTLSEGVALNEIVVTAIGLEANRANLGYSVQNVEAEELVEARTTNVVNALNGRVAGVQITSSSGSPGSSASIRIRGATSINGTNSPLFVIDGVPISNQEFGNGTAGVDQSNRAVDLNPNDIESMSVLKGPAATALYGVRAANGAIIVTTKQGAQGKPRISLNVNYTADRVNKINERQFEFAQGQPGDTDGDGALDAPVYLGPETANGNSWGPAINTLEFDGATDYPYDRNGRLVPAGTGNGQPANAYDPFDLFQTGMATDINLGVSGGTERLRYYMSAGYLDSEGVVPNATFERKTIRANVSADLTDRLTATINATYINSGGNRIQRGSNLNGIMLGTVRTTPTFDNSNGFGADAVDNPDAYIVPGDGSQRSYRAGVYDNPYFTINNNPFNDNVNRITGFAALGYELAEGLQVSYKLGLDQYTDTRLGAFDINKSPFGFNWNDGAVYTADYFSNDLNSDLLLTFQRDLNEDFGLSAVIGHNYYRSQLDQRFSTGTTLAIPGLYNLSNTQDVVASQSPLSKELVGALATVDLDYQNAVFLNLTARNDWSSILPQDDNTFFSYSASLGWAFTETFGMGNDDILPYGKLRLSYGQVGNDGGNAFIYATGNYFNQASANSDGFISNIIFPAFGVNAFERSTVLGNPFLRPETTSTFEVGGEFKFLKGRLGVDFTYYDSRSEDIIISTPVPASSGFTNVIQNSAVITNSGVELLLTGTPVRTSGFTWDITANFTSYENTVEELAPGVEEVFLAGFVSTSARLIPGNPYSALFGSGYLRNDNGDIVVGANGYPLVDPVPGFLGDPNPDFTLGIRNTFSIGQNFSISALVDIREGGDQWCGTCGVANYFGVTKVTGDLRNESFVFDGVLEDGTPNTTAIPYYDPSLPLNQGNFWQRYGFGGIGEQNIHDTSWIRLREARVAYTFPKVVTEKLRFSDLTIALTGRNLILITDYPGIDPETNLTGTSAGFGLDYFNMPNTRSFNVGVTANF